MSLFVVLLLSLFTFVSMSESILKLEEKHAADYHSKSYKRMLLSTTKTLRVGYIEFVMSSFGYVTSTTQAQNIMNANLNTLETYVREASLCNVRLLVWPEFALTGLVNYMLANTTNKKLAREQMYYYLEKIPQANLGSNSTACNNANFNSRPILQRLSCMAKNYNMTLSVNWGDYVICSSQTDPKCPSDGRYQYNTQIVFDHNGQIIAKYYKLHSFDEVEFDSPTVINPVYFNMTVSGTTLRVGILTCFDAMYATPLWELMKTYNVNFFIISQWWVNSFSTSSAVQWFQALSRMYGINLVTAANSWFFESAVPTWSSGSGIFSQGTILSSYFNEYNSPTSYLDYRDITISINGPYLQYVGVASYLTTYTQPKLFQYCYGILGSATPGTTLSQSVSCPTFQCSFQMKIASDSTSASPEYWRMMGIEGYYSVADGNNIYYYEKICEAYKCTNSLASSCVVAWTTKTKIQSFKMSVKFNETSIVPFPLMLQNGGNVYSKIMGNTTYSLSNGVYEFNGTNMDDYILDIVAQGRVYGKDALYA